MTATTSSSGKLFNIPTVDISSYLKDANGPRSQEIVSQIRQACITSGFFQIVGHGIDGELQKTIIECARDLFHLPLEEKSKLQSGQGRGYELIGSQTLQPGMKADMKEGYFIGPEVPDDAASYRDFRHPNRWPPEHLLPSSTFKVPLTTYRSQLCTLSRVLMEILAKGLPYGNSRIFDPFCSDPLAVVRLLHYPPQPDLKDPRQVGAGAHTDFGAITLLMQDDKGGLQVLNEETGNWIDVEPNSEAYVVNVGDMLQMWTRGEYKSNIHRVINSSGEHRYSVPFFFDGNLDYVLTPLDGSDTHGLTVEQFMRERYNRTYN